jgi:hypothetical protein
MGLIVDVVTASNLVGVVTENVKNSKVVEATNGIADFVDVVIRGIGNDRITALRIWGHGRTYEPDGNALFAADVLSADTIDQFTPILSRLRSCFLNPARAELRGCAAAKGRGKEMMKKLAGIWNVDVYGSEKSQHLVTMWQPPVMKASANAPQVTTVTGIEVFEGR